MKALLITGGAGFIGANFIPYFLKTYPNDYSVVNLDKLTYAGDLNNLTELNDHPRYTFVEGDICDQELITALFETHQFHGVIHFAAESHVDNSITGPEAFIDTNVKGTFNLLHAAKTLWMKAPFQVQNTFSTARFHHISTDEVYGSLGPTGFFTEKTAYAPNSPYSASKASSDFLVRSYHHTFGLNTTISNCSNNFGPKQHDEKLIPTIIRNALSEQAIPIYGDGKNSRDWLYVLDHCTAIDRIFHDGRSGETYNIGTNNEYINLAIAKHICSLLDDMHPRKNKAPYANLIQFVKDRPGHDQRYAIDAEKIKKELGWKATSQFEEDLKLTIAFYIKKYT